MRTCSPIELRLANRLTNEAHVGTRAEVAREFGKTSLPSPDLSEMRKHIRKRYRRILFDRLRLSGMSVSGAMFVFGRFWADYWVALDCRDMSPGGGSPSLHCPNPPVNDVGGLVPQP